MVAAANVAVHEECPVPPFMLIILQQSNVSLVTLVGENGAEAILFSTKTRGF